MYLCITSETMHPFSTSAITFYLLSSTFANALVMHEWSSREAAAARAKAISPEVKANVSATINQWLSDIQAVNTFVDTVRSCENPTAISSQAADAFKAAQNEGVSNSILQQDVTLDNSGKTAAQALLAQFNIIGPAINDTIFNPNNLNRNLDAINGAR